MTERAGAWVTGIALALIAGGCAGTGSAGGGLEGSGRSPSAPAVHQHWTSCSSATAAADVPDAGQEALTLPRLEDDFAPVAAVLCRTFPQRRESGGEDLIAVEERAVEVTALLSALRLPDETPSDGPCTMELPFVPWLALVDEQGRWVRPGVPVDSCHKPRQEFRTAFGQLATERVTTRVVSEIESDEAAASGCSQKWADMVWVTGRSGDGQVRTPDPLAADDAQVRVCVYAVPRSEQGSGKPGGEFVRGGRLAAGRWAAIKRELAAARPAAACTTPAGRFAVLHLPAGMIYVELDGCRRALIEGRSGPAALRQGTAEIGSLLVTR